MSVFSKLKQMFGSGRGKGGPKLQVIDVSKRFELLGRMGQGSMSKVWRARDRSIGRTVCVKLLDKEKTAKFAARFPGLNRPLEGEICIVLRHPNVVKTFEHGITTDGEQYLIMELIEGLGLNFLIETKSASLNGRRIEYLVHMADGLEYIHKQGFMHRDICPRNLMVNQEGEVKYIDFGLAIPLRPEFCRQGNRTGTPNYLAPEIIRRVATDQRVDLFALGVTAYELFCNDLPWEKTQSMQTLMSHMNSPGKDPRTFRPDLDEETAAVLMKAVERHPADRFQSAAEFREALKALPKQDY